MKNILTRLLKIANNQQKIIEKLVKIASDSEADSTMVTLAVRPIANAILDKECPNILNLIYKMGGADGARIGGNFILNAAKLGNLWKINTASCTLGYQESQDPKVNQKLLSAVNVIKIKICQAIQNELNTKSSMFGQATTITNHETKVNEQ